VAVQVAHIYVMVVAVTAALVVVAAELHTLFQDLVQV
jgi:hypothetical protein